MKKFFFLLLLLVLTMLGFSQQKFVTKELRGAEADAMWPGAEHIWLKQGNTVPAFIQFKAALALDEETFLLALRKAFKLPATYSFTLLATEPDELGWQHKRYQLQVNGIPVREGIFLLHLLNDRVLKYNGYLYSNVTAATVATLPEATALAFALNNVKAQIYKWQLPEEESFLKIESGKADATFYPKGELEIVQVGNNQSNDFKLAWKFDVYAHQPMSRNYVYVDARTGEVLKKTERIHEANANGTATTVYRGNRPIVADSYTGGYRLRETTRGLGIRTYNMLKGTNYGNAVDFVDANNAWNNVNANLDQYAGDAHWGAEMTYDFYSTMGRNSIDNAGFALYLYMHYNTNYVNAFWDGTRMTFGDGNGTYDPLVSLDITGHEITHGLTERTSNLDYSYESGALNESFSDIFGAAVEWYADSTVANWLIGEDIGAPFRSMSNPNTYGDPDTYGGTNWYTGTGDNGGVHINSGVQNHWYYRLSVGGTGTNDLGNAYNVTAIGRNKATRIAWRNDVVYLTSTSDYADARFYAIQSANDIYGVCSQEAISTTRAWYAVGVGPDFVYGTDAQFTASPVSGCTAPFTVTFNNTSTNASAYSWTFGDGGTSTALNPTYTYNALGTYTVKLVTSGSCGVDSLIRTNYISVSTSNPCVVIMPVTGTYQIQTACTGTIYDNGGTANYTDNTNSVVTIAPTGASQVRLDFTQFNMEANYDYVYVYDGPTTASPVIASFTGTTIPADVVSSGSSVTIRQYSDQSVVAAGFTIQWTCINPNAPPTANFKADVTQSCSGGVKFTDLTVGGPNAWLWNFGDGATSTQQHPIHNYLTNGTFTVSLQATNNFGNNTATKTNYITITKPAGPAATGGSNCGPQAFTLSTASANPVTWFDSAGNVVSATNPFTTPVLNTTTAYYVQDTQPQPIYKVGPLSNAIGSGSNYNSNQTRALRFRVFKKSKLVSVLVYAQGDGYRTVQHRDSLGGVITNKTIFIPNGSSRITLNLDLVPGTYELGLRDTMNLYRNSTGAVYPYNDANGIVSIYGNNAANSATYYYYFYDWEVKEADCISRRTPVVATVKPALNAVASSTNILCSGANNGTAAINLTGGTPAFAYQWSNSATTSSISNLPAGTYTVTATDAAGCTASASRTITQPGPLAYSTTITNVLCNGAATGAIDLGVSGGTTGYTYNWNGGITSQDRTNIAAGNYAVTITDANNCTASATATVTQPAALNAATTATNVLCNGSNTGAVLLAVTGGNGGYSYSWTGGATTQNISNLSAGTYTVTVTDANGCSTTASAVVGQVNGLNPTSTITNVLCNGQNTGAINLSVSGGQPGYTYLWAGGNTSQTRTALAAGIYPVTITDANACSATLSITVTQPVALSTTLSATNILCNGNATGSIDLNVTGGNNGYSYLWSNGSTAQDVTALSAGSYTVTVSDGNNCTSSATTTIAQPAALSATTTATNASCYNTNTGAITLTANGGAGNYTYNWTGGATTQNLNQLSAGTYSVTITDANGCTTTASAVVNQPAAVSLSTTASNVACNGSATGSINLTATGGTGNLTYSWSGGLTGQNVANVTAGTYTVTATDANGCSATAQATITEPTAINISVTANNAACGQNNGSASASVSGGTAGYSYSWSNSATTLSISALGAGNYVVTVTDNAGCTATATAIVNNTGSPAVVSSAVNATCFGTANGSAQVNVSSGTPPYTYQWSNGAVTPAISNIAAGTYTATVTDGAGCLSVITQVVTEPTSLSVTTSSTLATCGANNGTALATVTGGTQGYTFVWSDNSTAAQLSNLAAGTYYVTVTDANNCTGTGTALVNSASSIVATIAATNISCYGAANGTAGVNIASAQQPVTYAWSNGETTASLTNLTPGTFTVTITDGNNCPAIQQVTITEPDALTVTQTVVSPRCYGDNNGSVDITATGGTLPYVYDWSGGSAINLTAGTYTTTITDAAGCSVTSTAILTNPAPLALTTTATNVVCSGAQNGSATVSATGGTGGYEYLWSNFNSTPTVQNLPGGNYTIQVSDSNGCSATAAVTIAEAGAIQFATATTNANIGAADGGVQVTSPTGGTAPFSFAWSTGDTTQNLTAIAGGTYSVTVTDSNGCTETATVIVQENPNSVPVVAEEFSFSIYPNPAYNQVLVAVSKTGSNTNISIKNILGQQLYMQNLHSTTTSIDLSLFAAGVYMLELNTGERKLVKELIIGR